MNENPQLEQAIREQPDDARPYLAYGDWLSTRGDPRGELIAVQHRLSQATGTELAQLREKEKELLIRHASQFLGPLAAHIRTHDFANKVAFVWELGFIKAARLSYEFEAQHEQVDLGDVLRQILAHPSGRFLRQLTVGMNQLDSKTADRLFGAGVVPLQYQPLVDALVAARPTTLRSLFLGDFLITALDVVNGDAEMSWTAIGDCRELWRAIRRLRTLILQGGSFTLGSLDLPDLRHAEFRTGGLSRDSLRSIIGANWPRLERLIIWFGAAKSGAEADVEDLLPLLQAKGLNRLKHLGLMNAEFTNEMCEVLVRAPLLPQLEVLDLSMGTLDDEGARSLLKAAPALRHLALLNLERNFLTEEMQDRLKRTFPNVKLGVQRIQFDNIGRYVDVGEWDYA